MRGVSDFIDTRRGSIGPEARTRLAEAVRQLQAAQDKQATNISEAIAHANGAAMLAGQAQQIANSDVARAQRQYNNYGGFGGGGSNTGAMLGGILIGNILSGRCAAASEAASVAAAGVRRRSAVPVAAAVSAAAAAASESCCRRRVQPASTERYSVSLSSWAL